jgi:glycosyltransferase involved in cell wall biosynthesis
VRLAFVTPRYGADLVGGAEAQVREAAHGLAVRGHDVEVLTTVATDARTWAPAVEPGTSQDGAVTVRRFPLAAGADPTRRDELDHLVLSGRPLDVETELAWVDARFQVPAMVRHLTDAGGAYDAVAYSPYLFWTTLRCLPLTRARSVLVPCLHDEPLARLRIVRATIAAAAEVWFLSEPEHQLAHRLVRLGPHRVVGSAVHEPPAADAERFRRRHGIRRPFALYAGRREDGKGWPQAVAGFAAAVERHGLDLDLVTVGTGEVRVDGEVRRRVVDLGFLDAAEVPDAFAAASVFLQPSPNESFSRTVMEAWLAGVPVVATAAGEVVAWHCERSGGGLLYGDEIEMAECIRALVEDPAAAAALGAAGRAYVRATATWPSVLDGMEEALAAFPRAEGGHGDEGGHDDEAGHGAEAAASRLAAQVRQRAVQWRRGSVAMTPGFPLAPWLPAPGAGGPGRTPAGAVAGTGPAPPAGGGSRPLMGAVGALAGAWRRWPRARRLVGAARAARAAWGGDGLGAADRGGAAQGAVAPSRDVR